MRPGSARESITWDEWRHRWVISIPAQPRGGEANQAVTQLLAERLQVSPQQVEIVSGLRSHAKRVRVEGLDPSQVSDRLSSGNTTATGRDR